MSTHERVERPRFVLELEPVKVCRARDADLQSLIGQLAVRDLRLRDGMYPFGPVVPSLT